MCGFAVMVPGNHGGLRPLSIADLLIFPAILQDPGCRVPDIDGAPQMTRWPSPHRTALPEGLSPTPPPETSIKGMQLPVLGQGKEDDSGEAQDVKQPILSDVVLLG